MKNIKKTIPSALLAATFILGGTGVAQAWHGRRGTGGVAQAATGYCKRDEVLER